MLDPTSVIRSEADVAARLQPVLLGGDILTYTWLRCFHQTYGVRSIVLGGADAKAISASRFCDYRVVPGVDQQDVCLAELRRLGPELVAAGKVPLVLGTGDWYARTLSQYKDELSQWFVVPYIDFDLLDQITQKERFYAICEELNIPYPKTWTFDCADPAASIPVDDFAYPLIAKPSNSARYHYAQIPNQKKVYTIETPAELAELFANLQASSYDRELIVQDLVPGADDGLRTITCFSDANGDVRVWSTGRVLLEDHMPTAIGNPVCILLDRNDQIAAQAARFLKHVGYRGFSNFDVKYDPRDGSYRFFEVNTRPGRNTFYMQIGGANIARLLVDEYVLGRPVPERVACDEGLYSVVPRYVVRRTVADKDARRRALTLFDQGRAQNPLFYRGDTLAHGFWARLQYANQVRKFKRYVWDVQAS
jgi:D-aspartate ligase